MGKFNFYGRGFGVIRGFGIIRGRNMELKKIKKGTRALNLYGWEFTGTREEWIKYKKDNRLFPAGLYQIGRREITVLVLPNGTTKSFSKRG